MITPSRLAGNEYDSRIVFEDDGSGGPTAAAQLLYSGNNFLAQDAIGIFNLRRPWMNHFDGPSSDVAGRSFYSNIVWVSGVPVPATVTWYSDSALTKLVASETYIYSATVKVLPVTIIYRKYASDGTTVAATATDTISYSNGVFESGRIRAFS